MNTKILEYLKNQYHPMTMIVYGSYMDGTATASSDFDAFIVCNHPAKSHDTSIIDNVILDVFLYTPEQAALLTPEDILQVYKGLIVIDHDNIGATLIQKVESYVSSYHFPEPEDLQNSLIWCRKMQKRTREHDAEGYYRWHWLLIDSLQIYCDIKRWFYFGPKKTIGKMAKEDSDALGFYEDALRNMNSAALDAWLEYLERLLKNIQLDKGKPDFSSDDIFTTYWRNIERNLRFLDQEPYIDDQPEIDEIWNLCNEMIQVIDFSRLSPDFKSKIWANMADQIFYDYYGAYDPMYDLSMKMCQNSQEELTFAAILEQHGQKDIAAELYQKHKRCDDAVRCMRANLRKDTKKYIQLIDFCEESGLHDTAVEIAMEAYNKCRDNGMTYVIQFLLKDAIAKNNDTMCMKLLRSAKSRRYVNTDTILQTAKESGYLV